eukprot:1854141-Alexandrium_andersonii.AAC.1
MGKGFGLVHAMRSQSSAAWPLSGGRQASRDEGMSPSKNIGVAMRVRPDGSGEAMWGAMRSNTRWPFEGVAV